jgi:hypothetical protein
MKYLFDFLEKGSAWLDKISKPMEGKMAYFFCFTQIVVCLMAIIAAAGFFIYNFAGHTAFEVRASLILFIIVILFMLGGYAHMLITRDLKHIREQNLNKSEDAAKKRKIEF